MDNHNIIKNKFDRPIDILNFFISKAHQSSTKLIKLLQKINKPEWNRVPQIVTCESLTGGLIFSTLVDIPIGGIHKYGCLGVYDTDAKRTFCAVSVDDVYTHECAREMAIGALVNSNATISIAVTGNAMPDQTNDEDMKKLGEVFIGVATYITEKKSNNDNIMYYSDEVNKFDETNVKILVRTTVINLCNDNDAKKVCSMWAESIKDKAKIKNVCKFLRNDESCNKSINLDDLNSMCVGNGIFSQYNDLESTATLSNIIRNMVVNRALLDCFGLIYPFVDPENRGGIPSELFDGIKNDIHNTHKLCKPIFVENEYRAKNLQILKSERNKHDVITINNNNNNREYLRTICTNVKSCINDNRIGDNSKEEFEPYDDNIIDYEQHKLTNRHISSTETTSTKNKQILDEHIMTDELENIRPFDNGNKSDTDSDQQYLEKFKKYQNKNNMLQNLINKWNGARI